MFQVSRFDSPFDFASDSPLTTPGSDQSTSKDENENANQTRIQLKSDALNALNAKLKRKRVSHLAQTLDSHDISINSKRHEETMGAFKTLPREVALDDVSVVPPLEIIPSVPMPVRQTDQTKHFEDQKQKPAPHDAKSDESARKPRREKQKKRKRDHELLLAEGEGQKGHEAGKESGGPTGHILEKYKKSVIAGPTSSNIELKGRDDNPDAKDDTQYDEIVNQDVKNDAQHDDVQGGKDLEVIPQPKLYQKPRSKPSKSAGLPPWLLNPIRIPTSKTSAFSSLDLPLRLLETLKKRGLEQSFAVQGSLIPALLHSPGRAEDRSDFCVSAPTGSGKTLAYILPILAALRTRQIVRLRAVVVVPTRELVGQVVRSFESFGAKTGLRIGWATSTRPLGVEQDALFSIPRPHHDSHDIKVQRLPSHSPVPNVRREEVGTIKVDILVCTPGRLVEHIQSSSHLGFTLEFLRYLVIDEADRLMNQSFQDWLHVVHEALDTPGLGPVHSPRHISPYAPVSEAETGTLTEVGQKGTEKERGERGWMGSICIPRPALEVQKLVFSATLATDPGLLALLHLRRPKLFLVTDQVAKSKPQASLDVVQIDAQPLNQHDGAPETQRAEAEVEVEKENPDDEEHSGEEEGGEEVGSFEVPDSLTEYYISTDADKPLTLILLLFRLKISRALIFTKSNHSATRLTQVLSLISPGLLINSCSADLPTATRKSRLTNFKNGNLAYLVCSDLLARGLDTSAQTVINYDSSIPTRVYIHRVGRTARGGEKGVAYSLVQRFEGRFFNEAMARIRRGGKSVRKVVLYRKGEGGDVGSRGGDDARLGGIEGDRDAEGGREAERDEDEVEDEDEDDKHEEEREEDGIDVAALRRKYQEALATLSSKRYSNKRT